MSQEREQEGDDAEVAVRAAISEHGGDETPVGKEAVVTKKQSTIRAKIGKSKGEAPRQLLPRRFPFN